MKDDNFIDYLNYVKYNLNSNPLYKYSKEFKQLPFMTEYELDKINKTYLKKNNNCVYFTSGTTAEPKAVYYNKNDFYFLQNYICWMCKIENIPKGSTVVVLMDQAFWGIGYITCLGHIKYGNKVVPIDTGLPIKTIKEIILEMKPSVVSSIPSVLKNYMQEFNGIFFDIIETTGEPLSKDERNLIETHYKGNVYDAYGLTELTVGIECKCHDGYHYKDDEVHIEIIDQDNNILPSNNYGEIVLTNLNKNTRPLIRYKTGDIGKIVNEKCSCGLNYPRVFIKGRLNPTYFLYEGYKLEDKLIKNLINKIYGHKKECKIHYSGNVLYIKIKNGSNKKNNLIKQELYNISHEMICLTSDKQIKIKIIS